MENQKRFGDKNFFLSILVKKINAFLSILN